MKKVSVLMIMFVCAFGVFVFNTQTVSAASKPVMKNANVKWDLKNNKTVIYKTAYAGIGMKKQKAKITNMKIRDSKTKKGYKECTFKIKYTRKWKMTGSEVHKFVNSVQDAGGGLAGFKIVDYNSGKSLNVNGNKHDVTVVLEKDWTDSTPTKYSDSDGCWVKNTNVSVGVKIIYPKNYKGLCIGVGGSTKLKRTNNDIKFSNGKVSFTKTSFCSKKDKTITHFMRVK